eukprot:6988100-Lingulodinium_polyedra.AAC.1
MWLDPECLPVMALGYWVKALPQQPHYIVNERTPLWPAAQFFERILRKRYRLSTVKVCPTDLGLPVRRPRVYTAAANNTLTTELL